MIRSILVLSLLLGTALAPGAALAEGGATGVTPIKVEEGKAIEVTGNIKSGKKIPLEWAEKSSVACFPALDSRCSTATMCSTEPLCRQASR